MGRGRPQYLQAGQQAMQAGHRVMHKKAHQPIQGGWTRPSPYYCQRCRRIEWIRCYSCILRSLDGCPIGLKVLHIEGSPHISDLSPLASCCRMVALAISDSSIADISVVASMPLLEGFACRKFGIRPSIKVLAPLSSCPKLRELYFFSNKELEDLSPLASCSALETLDINHCRLITSLAPLSTLKNLQHLNCRGVHPETSLLPLLSCFGLKTLYCNPDAVDLNKVKARRPELSINSCLLS